MQKKNPAFEDNFILAESGGNKTSWYIHPFGQEPFKFEGPSLHPLHWEENIDLRIPREIRRLDLGSFDLYFYGSGCFREGNQNIFRQKIQHLKFKSSSVYGDIEAAALATLYNVDGWFAILGSGSVVCQYNGSSITKIIGGSGITDDYGSGRRFGRLIQEQLECMDSMIESKYSLRLKEIEEIQFSKRMDFEDVVDFHKSNLQSFVNKLLMPVVPSGTSISIVGGYGFFLQNELKVILENAGYKLGVCIEQPIDHLIKIYTSNEI